MKIHRFECRCEWCAEGRALGRAMTALRELPPSDTWHELVRSLPADEWHELARVLVQRPDLGQSFTIRVATLRARLRWLWPNVSRVRIPGSA